MIRRSVLIEKSPMQIKMIMTDSRDRIFKEVISHIRRCVDFREVAYYFAHKTDDENKIQEQLQMLYRGERNPEDFFLVCETNCTGSRFYEGKIIVEEYFKNYNY